MLEKDVSKRIGPNQLFNENLFSDSQERIIKIKIKKEKENNIKEILNKKYKFIIKSLKTAKSTERNQRSRQNSIFGSERLSIGTGIRFTKTKGTIKRLSQNFPETQPHSRLSSINENIGSLTISLQKNSPTSSLNISQNQYGQRKSMFFQYK